MRILDEFDWFRERECNWKMLEEKLIAERDENL